MIISRTPFRVSFVGGGTDLPSFYEREPGQVLSTAIDKYVYVVVKRQLGIVEYKYRVNWSQTEFRNSIDEIVHPIVREALRYFNIDYPIEITTFADIPAGTGMGSSSAFAVGLVHALFALQGQMVTKYEIASLAAKIEVDILHRSMGKQDHFASCYGGLNVLTFLQDGTVAVDPVFASCESKQAVAQHLMLFYTKGKRDASNVLAKQEARKEANFSTLQAMRALVEPLREVFSSGDAFHKIGELLHQNWEYKKTLHGSISNEFIQKSYRIALQHGAIGGKLLGAGSGGFLLFFVKPERQEDVCSALDLYRMPFSFDGSGTRITYYDQTKV